MEVLYINYVNMYVIMEIVIFLSEWEEIESLTILPMHILIQHEILKNIDAYLVDFGIKYESFVCQVCKYVRNHGNCNISV